MFSTILIIDKRKELPIKYKKSLENEQTSVVISRNIQEGLKQIQCIIPDIIIISDSIEEDLSVFCEKIRTLTFNTRPIIIALSKSADIQDRIKILEHGADDFWGEPVNIDEFRTRIQAHLRRDIEINLDNKTLLPNKKIVEKNLKRLLNSEEKQATLLISIENLNNYKSVYSEIAGDKIIQTLIAIIKSTVDTIDFLGQIDEKTLIIITNPYGAEKLAAFLTFAFDTVAPKFYSNDDVKRGYIILKGDREAGMRINFVSILISGIIDNYKLISTPEGLLERLYSIKEIARIPQGSNYAIDRLKLSGDFSNDNLTNNNQIFISETDSSLALLLRTSLELQGYDVIENINVDNSIQPKILIIDTDNDLSGLNVCKALKEKLNFVNSKIIMTSSQHNKQEILSAGADLYLPKPYEITDLIQWIEYFIKK